MRSMELLLVVALYGCALPPLKGDLVNIEVTSTAGLKNPGENVCRFNTERNGFRHSQLSEEGGLSPARASLQFGYLTGTSWYPYSIKRDGIFFSLSCGGNPDNVVEDEQGSLNFIHNFELDVYIDEVPVGVQFKERIQFLSTIARKGIEVQGVALTKHDNVSDVDVSNGNYDTGRIAGVVTVPYELHDVRGKCSIGVGGSPFVVTRGTLTIPPQLPLSEEEALQTLKVSSEGNGVFLREWTFSGEIQGFVC